MPEQFGWMPNLAATERFVASLPAIYGDQVAMLAAGDDGRDALNYRALATCLQRAGLTAWLKQRDGVACVRSLNQGPVGTCVGNAEARLLDVLAAIEIAIGNEPEEFVATFSPEGLYGLGREKGNMLSHHDGLYGAAIADAVRQWGTLHQVVYGNIDLRKYDPDRCRDFGYRGVPAELKPLAAAHLVVHTARVIQLGFAGFAFLLVFVIVWLIRRLLAILDQTGKIISGNTLAINRIQEAAEDQKDLMKDIRDQLFQRPCLLQKDRPSRHGHEGQSVET